MSDDNNSMRLAAPLGSLINRDKQLSFTFAGKKYFAYEGDTVASALLAHGHHLISRSFKYHRPRGPLTMAGRDANTLIQRLTANGSKAEPNILADKELVVDGDVFDGQNYSGTLENDRGSLLGYFGRFMPVGFYYSAFYKTLLPSLGFGKNKKDTWGKWEPLIRRKAGLGVLDLSGNLAENTEGYDKEYRFYDVIVVGAGPGGMAAAIKAAEKGLSVGLVDEHSILGGSLAFNAFAEEQEKINQLRKTLVDKIENLTAIDVLLNTTCNGWFADNYLPLIQAKRMIKARAKHCIMATGELEQHSVFRNNDLPGVMLCSAVSRLLSFYGVKPGQQAVVLAGNDSAYYNALQLADNGIEVKAIIDMREESVNAGLLEKVKLKGISIKQGFTVYEALPTRGNKHIRAVDVRKIISRGKVDENTEIIDCDLLCVSAGFVPAYQLPCQAGAKLHYQDSHAEFNITDMPNNTSLAGSVNNKFSLKEVIDDGCASALFALEKISAVDEDLTKYDSSDKNTLTDIINLIDDNFYGDNFNGDKFKENEKTHQNNIDWPIFIHPKGKDFVDFDEDLQAQDIINATRLGYRDIQLVKRFSTVGMGPSQGRHSALATARLVADATNRTVTETGVSTARPPFAPEKLAHIAGECFEPYKRTSIHYRHLELGAQMMPAGLWQRPAFYGEVEHRDQCIQEESLHVRTKVGLIDVSTLGGIDVRGADAAEFMNRFYTFGFLKQPVGKSRYAIVTNEHGVVVDDGVACRIAEDYFYVTATTSGVDQVYRQMTWWNAQWRLDVDIANVTSAYCAVNLAGPDSRKVLQKLNADIDFSAEAFPYLAYREGQVADIPARCMRVGFVGELGYEIHVPSYYGEALWDVLMTAGDEFDIRPFGVEAQRLLRLEKGHIIIGQDSDGMSHPGELGLSWAINKKKPFYVGCRSVDIVMKKKQTRQLVGFTLPAAMNKPKEGHLVLDDKNTDDQGLAIVTGYVTSCEYSTSMKKIIGLAFVSVEQSTMSGTFSIRIDGGDEVQATVVELPFYDKDNTRNAV